MESFAANSPRNSLRIIILLTEVGLICLANELSYQLHAGFPVTFKAIYFPILGVAVLSWVSMGILVGSYTMATLFDPRMVLRNAMVTLSLQATVVFVFHYVHNQYQALEIPLSYFVESTLFTLLFVGTFRYAMAQLYMHRKALYHDYKAVIIGSGRSATAVGNYLRSQSIEFFHFADGAEGESKPDPTQQAEDLRYSIPSLKQFCVREGIKEIYYTLPVTDDEYPLVEEVWNFAEDHYITFRIAQDFEWLNRKDVVISFYGEVPVISMHRMPLASRFNRLVKRVFDLVFSLGVIVFIFPILLPILGLAIKLDSPGPIFFKQYRTGRRNRNFLCYKFRTMRMNADSDQKQATKGDNRITKLGAFLRKSSLDEFPQFLNVLKGDMSVVGPRPHMVKHTEEYCEIIKRFMFRHYVTPGITGWAQVNGYRGGTENPELMRKRVEYDTWYIENWSLWLDLRCIFLTVLNAIRGEKNAY